jgi:hypothetical protein
MIAACVALFQLRALSGAGAGSRIASSERRHPPLRVSSGFCT